MLAFDNSTHYDYSFKINSFFALAINLGLSISCIPVSAKVLAAVNIPLIPILVPPAATACQLCAGVPGTHVAALNPTVGNAKLTSPTSVDPDPLASIEEL